MYFLLFFWTDWVWYNVGFDFLSDQVRLETWQEDEVKQVKEKLGQELELLIAFQSKQRMQIDQQHEHERKQLDEKVSLRCAVLEQKVRRQSHEIVGRLNFRHALFF